jgi:membrane protein implicated in regulation of membrane protease activity
MEWSEHAWVVWATLAILLGVAEVFSLSLVLLMLAGGALVGALVAAIGLPVAVQVIAAGLSATAMLTFVRPSVVRQLHAGPQLVTGHAALIGEMGFAVDEVTVHGGQVKLRGEIWTARPYDDTEVIPPGAKVEVYQIKGATALVAQVPELGL